jgi:hypothetical protein
MKKPAKPKKPRAAKAPKADQKKPAPHVAGANSVDRDRQHLARVHRDKFIKLKAAQGKANRDMTALGKLIKEDGFTKKQIQIMAQLVTPEGEAAVKLSIAQSLEAARWNGSEIGNQLDLFMEPDRTPAVDAAYEQGVQDSMDGKSAVSPYDPSLPQTQSYLKGFADDQERRMKNGFKQKEPEGPTKLITKAEKEAAEKEKEAAAWAAATAAATKPAVPSPSKPLTRKEAKEQAESVFQKPDRAAVLQAAREDNAGDFDTTKH